MRTPQRSTWLGRWAPIRSINVFIVFVDSMLCLYQLNPTPSHRNEIKNNLNETTVERCVCHPRIKWGEEINTIINYRFQCCTIIDLRSSLIGCFAFIFIWIQKRNEMKRKREREGERKMMQRKKKTNQQQAAHSKCNRCKIQNIKW